MTTPLSPTGPLFPANPSQPRRRHRWALLAALAVSLAPAALLTPSPAEAQISFGISVHIGPPPLPVVYAQPPLPAPGYIWSPGYWAWDDWWGDYYWVPGTWVRVPRPGYLWTPGYWGWNNGVYVWNGGYWGTHVGFYGGVNYGFGYGGHGYEGGEWHGNNFYYNRSASNVSNTNITNVYNKTVIVNNYNTTNNRTSFSGGPNGVHAQPTPQERKAMVEPHIAPTHQQIAHVQAAQTNRASFASQNGGKPKEVAVAQPKPAPHVPIHPPGMARPAPGGGVPSVQYVKVASSKGLVRPTEAAAALKAAPAAAKPTPALAKPAAVKPGPVAARLAPAAVPQAKPAPVPAKLAPSAAQPTSTNAMRATRPRPATEPRPLTEPRPEVEPRPMAEPRAATASEYQAPIAPRPAPVPHPAARPAFHAPTPRPASPPHPAAPHPAPHPAAPHHEGGERPR